MRERHDQSVGRRGGDPQAGGQSLAFNDKRVVARGLERAVNSAKNRFALVFYRRHLAVNGQRRAHHLAAKALPDRLMAKTDAENRHVPGGGGDKIEADARLMRRAGAGRQHDGVGRGGQDFGDAHLVVAAHGDIGPQLPEIMHEIKGEAVVIVDQRDIGHVFGPVSRRASLICH